MLAGVRIAAFLVIAPPFSHRAISGQVKAMLSIGLALAVSPRLGLQPAVTTGAFIGDIVLQVLIGAALGFVVYAVFSAIQAAGNLVDLFGGFQIAAAFDPMSMTSSAQFGRLYQFLGIVLLFASDGYQIVIAGLMRAFDTIPLGSSLDLAATAQEATHGLSEMFIAGFQIAGPLVAVLFLADVGLGLLTRAAPALNAFALGFPLKILITISLSAFALMAMPQLIANLTDQSFESMLRLTR
jgi:flagellar biosynthesis protein FliR